jgi:hypothetical protein
MYRARAKREPLNFGMAFEDADGDGRVTRMGQPPIAPAAAAGNGDNA